MTPYSPEDLQQDPAFELLKEVDHREIKAFILEQVYEPTRWLRYYGIYQVVMIVFYLILVGLCVQEVFSGNFLPLWWMCGAVIFSMTALVVLHELTHALVYWIYGIRNLKAGAIWRKFIFYVAADREVVDYHIFKRVALAPFILVNALTIIPGLFLRTTPTAYFLFSVLCFHSLFCAGDVAMLSFYHRHSDKVIFNFDDLEEGKTFFYARKKQPQ